MIFRTFTGIFGALVLSCQPAIAQDTQAAKPGNSNAEIADNGMPDAIPLSAFSYSSALGGAQLSPDGNRFAYAVLRGGDTYIEVYDSATLQRYFRLNLGNDQDFRFFRWAGNDKLLFSMIGTYRGQYRYSRLFYFDIERQVLNPLVSDRMAFVGDNIIHLDPAGNYLLTSFGTSWDEPPSVWRFDLTTDTPPEPVRVEQRQRRVSSWVADEAGNVRIGVGFHRRGRVQMHYRDGLDGEWERVAQARVDDEESGLDLWDFMGLRSDSDTGYSIGIPAGGERAALMEFDFSTGQPGDIVFASPDEDVASVIFDEQNNPIAVSYQGDEARREWLDPAIRDMRDQLLTRLTGPRVSILDIAADRSRMLVVEHGPAYPGALYVYTPAEDRLQHFAEFRPQIDRRSLAEPQAIRYDARDGTPIHGYLTLPVGREARGLPLIVMPHGGPYGVRDTDNYDDRVQMLANRGYAVVQPNFRGSGGYGTSFMDLGWGQIGRRMQDDLDDAVAHLVAEGIADPQRVCLVGSSYGGFAAVWGVIRNPEIYRCAASWAGVMHFERQLNHDRDYLFGQNARRWRERVDGDQTDFDLDDVSPAVQVERLTRPVLLAHGQRDNTVPFSQYQLMVGRAERADVLLETLALEGSGHNFFSRADEETYHRTLLDFLAEHNPAD
ncbi:alpha/beta hydrolase family protein [Aurantiacibacter sediminis]|uniref:S9 family peptidase n=1 Tax=Aurantiacibacter sediminis TaxID=2793064 RepID=A0ABS0N2J5_9SPHN|nr:alpha/beta fold hydrolase [Aurantiacibacter sediminis]MBH5322172.1 S9 family peptidase [Aurantiacibacter sediminis]